MVSPTQGFTLTVQLAGCVGKRGDVDPLFPTGLQALTDGCAAEIGFGLQTIVVAAAVCAAKTPALFTVFWADLLSAATDLALTAGTVTISSWRAIGVIATRSLRIGKQAVSETIAYFFFISLPAIGRVTAFGAAVALLGAKTPLAAIIIVMAGSKTQLVFLDWGAEFLGACNEVDHHDNRHCDVFHSAGSL